MSSFSGRINLAYCLGWISDEARRDLHVIRDLRNRFAHGFEHSLSLADAEFMPTLGRLQFIRSGDNFLQGVLETVASPKAPDNLRKHLNDPRRKFVSSVGTLALLLSVARNRAQPPAAKDLELVPMPLQEFTLDSGETAEIDLKTGHVRRLAP